MCMCQVNHKIYTKLLSKVLRSVRSFLWWQIKETICDFLTYLSTYKLSLGLFVIYCKFCLCRILVQIYFAVLFLHK